MSTSPSLHIERIDDVPLLIAQMERMRVRELLDMRFRVHGNWLGESLGWVVTIWLAYLLSEGDHRLNQVELWVAGRTEALRRCTGQFVDRLDFTDDRLAAILKALADHARFREFEARLARSLLRVYALPADTVRVDMTTASSEQIVTPAGLFQFGYSKDDRPDCPQVKIALAALDPMGLPLATAVVPGNQADDPLYLPLIRQVRESLGGGERLYVGDCKMAALETRATVHQGGDYYLCPLAGAQLPPAVLDTYLAAVWADEQALTVLMPPAAPGEEPQAKGFEIEVELTATVEKETGRWTERRLVVRAPARAKSEAASLQRRVGEAKAALEALNERGHGKRRQRDGQRLAAQVVALQERYQVAGLLTVRQSEQRQERRVRGYRGLPERVQTEVDWQVAVEVDPAAETAAIRRLGWRVYATDAPAARLPMAAVVPAYREQYLVERGIGRLKGRPLGLCPLYLQKEEHVIGLIHLLALALRVLCLVEFQVRRGLAATGESLAGLYAGQPRRATARPTSEMLLRAFKEVNVLILPRGSQPRWQITALSALQQRILALLELPADTYSRLCVDSLHPLLE